MTSEASLRQADELLAELIELIETARSLPMSSSCVLPRERLLDMLDDLREVLPPELREARKVIEARDQMLHNAYTQATDTRAQATAGAEAVIADARQGAEHITALAQQRAQDLIASAEDEQVRLVAASAVHQAATDASTALRAEAEAYRDSLCSEADEYHAAVRAEGDRYARGARAEAERYAAKLATDAETYAEDTLAELAATLRRAASTADQGRSALSGRRAGSWTQSAAPADPKPDAGSADEPYDHARSA